MMKTLQNLVSLIWSKVKNLHAQLHANWETSHGAGRKILNRVTQHPAKYRNGFVLVMTQRLALLVLDWEVETKLATMGVLVALMAQDRDKMAMVMVKAVVT
jgi:hypothetical protein